MKLAYLSSESQRGLRQWATDVYGDQEAVVSGAEEWWAWICYQLRISEDRPEWFPKGKWTLIQVIESHVYQEAFESMPAGTAFQLGKERDDDRL